MSSEEFHPDLEKNPDIKNNPWYQLKFRYSTLWERLPIIPLRELHLAFHKFTPKEFNFLVTIQMCMTLSRRKTNDAIWEIPTTESLTALHNILKNTNKTMSPFCGIALYEKLLTNLGHDIIAVDNFSSHETSNPEARQMPVEEISFEVALEKYPEVDTLLCIWTPVE